MAGGRSTEALRNPLGRLRALNADERLALVGVAAIAGSLLLPWWGDPAGGERTATGVGELSLVEAALLTTAAALLFLLLELGGGYVPPRPLRAWGLLVAGGTWAALIVVYRALDRPELPREVAGETYELLWYGAAAALGGAALVIAAGLRLRGRPPPAERSAQAWSPYGSGGSMP